MLPAERLGGRAASMTLVQRRLRWTCISMEFCRGDRAWFAVDGPAVGARLAWATRSELLHRRLYGYDRSRRSWLPWPQRHRRFERAGGNVCDYMPLITLALWAAVWSLWIYGVLGDGGHVHGAPTPIASKIRWLISGALRQERPERAMGSTAQKIRITKANAYLCPSISLRACSQCC